MSYAAQEPFFLLLPGSGMACQDPAASRFAPSLG
jgi:hypothetical protein